MEPWVKRMYRALPVCVDCWNDVFPNRPASEPGIPNDERECIVCEKPMADGLWVSMRVEWETTLGKAIGLKVTVATPVTDATVELRTHDPAAPKDPNPLVLSRSGKKP